MNNKETTSNIQVAIKVRPMLSWEWEKKQFETIKIEDNLIIAFDPIDLLFQKEGRSKLDVYHRSREQKYAFDRVFTEEPIDLVY